eukprot:TRINITY_DN20159_c0_g1_i1.p1 TRINITY_DN20159_c0_g1~~TRINITY_DN20159_c0_g1_i1.p1  ORF type:complete len:336 (+),score=16.12 TRINITY_DN20159_c0_g1_i1:52-1008(+)
MFKFVIYLIFLARGLSSQGVASPLDHDPLPDMSTPQGRQRALKRYLQLHNLLGEIGWLPFDMNFGISRWQRDRSAIIDRFALEKHWFPMIIGNGWVKGPTCLDWGRRYISTSFKDICTDPYEITFDKKGCDGNFGTFKNNRGYCADIHSTQGIVPDDKFDTVICTMVFEHLQYPSKAIVNVYNMLKPGGTLVFVVPQISIYHDIPDNFYFYTVQGAVLLLQDAGFCVKYAHGIMSTFTCLSMMMGMSKGDITWKGAFNTTDDIGPCQVGVVAYKPQNQGEECPEGDYPTVQQQHQYRFSWGNRVRREQHQSAYEASTN